MKRISKSIFLVASVVILIVVFAISYGKEYDVYYASESTGEVGVATEETTEPTEKLSETVFTEEVTEEPSARYDLTELSRNFSSYGGTEDESYLFVKDHYHNLVTGKTMHLYSLYDALMTRYPEYISRTQIATTAEPTLPVYWESDCETIRTEITSDSVFPMYRYDFCIPAADGERVDEKPKILYISGIHGGEYQQVFAAYRFFKMLCEDWEEETLLGELHENVHFVVIPIANPFGFNYPSGRYNAAGVNVSRYNERNIDVSGNFPSENFYEGTEQMYGTESLTEPESQAIYKVITEEEFILSVDNHTFGYLATEYTEDLYPNPIHMGGRFIVGEGDTFWGHIGDYLDYHIRELSEEIDNTVAVQSDGSEFKYADWGLFYLKKDGKEQMLCNTFRGVSANVEMVVSIDPENYGYSDGATPYMPVESQAFLVDQIAVIFYEAYIHLSK